MMLARALIVLGLALAAAGAVLAFCLRFHLPLGRLPGDLVYRGRHGTIYFPWVTMLLISAILTVALRLLHR